MSQTAAYLGWENDLKRLHMKDLRSSWGSFDAWPVNSHAHTPMTLVRGAGDGLPLMDWLTKVMWPREGQMTSEDALWGMRLGAAEMFLSGVTSTCEMYLFEEALVEASQDVGIRLVMTPGIISALHGDSSWSY